MINIRKIKRILIKAGTFCKLNNMKVNDKNINDIVTNIDLKVEEYIINKIKKIYPSDIFIAEETRSKENIDFKRVWIIDPIDGTYNFANKINMFAIQIAFVFEGNPIFSAIYNPATNEFFYAFEGKGAFLGKQKLTTKTNLEIKKAIITLPDFKSEKNKLLLLFKMLNDKVARIQIHSSAAFDFALLAKGSTDAHIINMRHIWDYLPGQFLAEKAGANFCKVKILNDTSLLVSASNEEILKSIVNELKGL